MDCRSLGRILTSYLRKRLHVWPGGSNWTSDPSFSSCFVTILIGRFIVDCVQEPEGPSGPGPGQTAARQQKTPADPSGVPTNASGGTDPIQNLVLGSLSSQGPGHAASDPPSSHPPTQAPPTKSDRCPFAPTDCPSSAPQRSPLVDVRMIDFAHSTFKGFRGDTAVHDGPDRGYVFGLESLIQILESLRDENLP